MLRDSANIILEQITKKRVARTLEALDLARCDEYLKNAVKKQLWEFKEDVESKVLGKGSNNDGPKNPAR